MIFINDLKFRLGNKFGLLVIRLKSINIVRTFLIDENLNN